VEYAQSYSGTAAESGREFDRWMQEPAVGAPKVFARGGFVQEPTVGLVGERGPEFVIPARKNSNSMELLQQAMEALAIFRGTGEHFLADDHRRTVTLGIA
jgi:hypothetical protein